MTDFLKFYELERDKLFYFVLGRVGNRDDAEDIVSDVFVRAIRFEDQGGDVTHLHGLVYRIAKNLIADHYRGKIKQSKLVSIHDERDGERAMDIPDTLLSAADLFDRDLAADEIKTALSRLRDESREVIVLRYLEQREIEEIAAVLEKSEGAVRVQLHRALNELRDLWEK